MGDWNKCIIPSDSRLDLPGKGLLFELDFINGRGGDKMWALFKSLPWPLYTSGLDP